MAAQASVPASGADSGARRRRRQGLLRRILLRGGRLTRIARRAVGCAGAGLLAFAAAAPAQAQGCRQTAPGAFVCAGPIAQAQSLSAEDGPLAATLSGDDPVNVASGTALTLTGDRSIHLVQVSGAAPIQGAEAGVRATLRRDGSLTIDLAGSVTGGASGIVASATGGAARIAVAGTVEGTARHGILAEAKSVAVRAGTARGALSGVHAVVGSGTAAIAVDAAAATASGTGVSGIHLRTGAGAAGATVSAGRIASSGHGIVILHAGSATASVAADAVRAAADGIAVTASGAGGVDIRAAAVDAASGTAIRLEGSFSGGAAISATGRIAGGGDAVRVQSDAAAGALGTRRSLAISVTEAAGGANGVWASFDGDGDLAVSATGSVTGGAGHGIRAATGARTRRLTISAADVSGAATGIHAVHEGRSMLSIAASGSVTGAAAEGIRAVAHPGAGAGRGDASPGLRIAAATVSGATHGIHAVNRSTGPMTISATGPVSGKARNGLTVLGGRTASPTIVSAALVSGGIDGARFEHFGPGDLTVSIARSVAAQDKGVLIIRGGGGNTQLTVGSVKSARTGVHIQTHGTGTHALSVGSVESNAEHGVDLSNGFNNSISLSATGTIIARGLDGIKNFSTNNSWPRGNDATNSVTIANATVTGTRNGIYSRNGGNLNLSISASGPVTGLSQAGIQIYSVRSTSARRTTISATDVTGGSWGIKIHHNAHGRLSIATSGSVTGRTRDGIEIAARDPTLHEYGLPQDIAITTASVTGAENGIEVSNELSGTLAISATGPVTGKSGTGIRVSGGSAAQSVTISAALASGGDAGVGVKHAGSGDVSISVAEAVGKNGRGVMVSAFSKTRSLTITAGSVTAGETGIYASTQFSGSVRIFAEQVMGSTGIFARAAASEDVVVAVGSVHTTHWNAINLSHLGTGNLSLSATGHLFTQSQDAIAFINQTLGVGNNVRGRGVSIAVATVTGGRHGINGVLHGREDISISASGPVTGRAGSGIRTMTLPPSQSTRLSVASVTGSLWGIKTRHHGRARLSISASGSVTGGSLDGIRAEASYYSETPSVSPQFSPTRNVSVAAATVTGAAAGIYITNAHPGTLFISATGSVTGMTRSGILAKNVSYSHSTTISAASVSGVDAGIHAVHMGYGDLQISATGKAVASSATAGVAIRAEGLERTGHVSVSATSATGGKTGILARNLGTGSLRVTATGDVVGKTAEGILAVNERGVGVTVSAASVLGATDGMSIENKGSGTLIVSATGSVTGRTGDGIRAFGSHASHAASVSAELASGEQNGVKVTHRGRGDLSISVAKAEGRRKYGIDAHLFAATGALAITAGSVTAGQTGIRALSNSRDGVSISAEFVKTPAHGIVASARGDSNVVISAGSVHAGNRAIYAVVRGGGAISFSATGQVSSQNRSGIYFISSNSGFGSVFRGRSVTISAATVTGGRHGIAGRHFGTENLSISASGPVTGLARAGITTLSYFRTTSASLTLASVTGGVWGIHTMHNGHGSLTISASGSVTGGRRDGIHAVSGDYRRWRSLHSDENPYGPTLSAAMVDVPSANASAAMASTASGNADTNWDIRIAAATVTGAVNGIRVINDRSGTLDISATGPVKGTAGIGILAQNASFSQSTTIIAASVSGGSAGIHALHKGSGHLAVSAAGEVVASSATIGVAIHAEGSHSAADVSVDAASATAGGTGILAANLGTGSLRVAATGHVAGRAAEGIRATNERGVGVTVAAASVDGATYGIAALSSGTGDLSVAAAGPVTGRGGEGIRAFAEAGGRDLTIAAASVTGASHGIFARNRGSGATSVSATGMVAGGSAADLHGVLVYNTATGAGVSVSVGGARGSKTGVTARNEGAGSLMVAATGSVTGGASHGIHARNANRGASLSVAAAAVAGGKHGILAVNLGSGATSVSATGMVAGGSAADLHGVLVYNTATGAGVSVSVGGARGSKTGVTARNEGAGSLMVAATGSVTGGASHGIHARNAQRGASLSVAAAAVAGGGHGILAANLGSGATSVSTTGMVAGGSAADLHGVLVYNTATGAGISVSVGGAQGSKTGVTARNEGAGSLMVAATGSVTGGASHGIHARNASRGASLTVAAAAVAGDGHGILAENLGSGATSVSAAGSINSGSGGLLHGIIVQNTESGGSVAVVAGDVLGARTGIDAQNLGTGTLSVTATGFVRGDGYDGIAVRSASGGTGLTVSAADVSGHSTGISANHRGSGDLSVTATGMVRGGGGWGISATSHAGASSLTIAAASVMGGVAGITALNRGTGATSVTATGHVESVITDYNYRGDGISVKAYHGDVAVAAADVTGQQDGIWVSTSGAGRLSVAATGTVRGFYGYGIGAFSGSSGTGLAISVASAVGVQSGIVAKAEGGGPLFVAATGRVTGHNADGVLARSGASGSSLTVSVASVTGGEHGIFAENRGTGITRVSATGLVTGGGKASKHGILVQNAENGAGILVSATQVRGGGGIAARNAGAGDISVISTGSITANSDNGIFADNGRRGGSVTVTAATVTGGASGILASNLGSGATSISATGRVSGGTGLAAHGIYAFNSAAAAGAFVSAATVTGGGTGITVKNEGAGGLSITASGSVTGRTDNGVLALNRARGANLTVSVASVTGVRHGIQAENFGAGATRVTATGMVAGGSRISLHGILAFGGAAGTGVFVSAADVRGGDGITAQNIGAGDISVAASGSVTAESSFGVFASNGRRGDSLTVAVATVAGQEHGIMVSNFGGGATSVSAAGPVSGGTGATTQGIFAFNSAAGVGVAVSAATVTGGATGITARNDGAGTLSIAASGSVTGRADHGVVARNSARGSSLTVSVAVVTGRGHGILAQNHGTGGTSVSATGPVAGGPKAGLHGILAHNTPIGSGVSVSAASVWGAQTGITARNEGAGGLAVTASGSVTAGSGTGIDAIGGSRGSGVRVEVGRVSGALHGIRAIGSGTGPLRVAATGDIVGGGAGHDGIHAQGAPSGSDLMVSAAAAVIGEDRGIRADNRGSGATVVSAGGPVSGGRGDGIVVDAGAAAGRVIVSVASVSGGGNGLIARSLGPGAMRIRASERVAGHRGDGIAASGNGGVDIDVRAVEGHSAGVVAGNGGRGSVAIAAADTVTGRGGGGIVATNGADGLNLEISAAAVRGATSGIAAENFGSGALSVAAAGLVASHDGTGIRAYNGMSGIGLAISGSSVSAQGHGIDAVNRGAGDLSIRLAGDAKSDLASGISARNSEAGVGLSVGAATAIGRRNGIFARNMGIGDLSVAVAGAVSGATRDGLHAYNGRFGLNLTVSAGSVEGFDNGVFARNVGNGALSVTVSSWATGGLNTGIRAHNSASGTDLTVAAGSASGRRFGIFTENRGHGSLSIVSSGAVSGIVDDGLRAANGASGSDLTISATEVSGRTMGIRAENDGSGSLRISATRNVSGGAGGAVLARSGARGSDVDVQIAAATGNSFGIKVRSMGLGAVRVAATGAVAAKTDDGIDAYGGPATFGLAIRAAGARGREHGIQAHLAGSGPVLVAATGAVAGVRGSGILARSGSRGDRIEVSAGTVSGGTNGIEVISENRQDILISVSGAVTGGTGAGVVAMTRGGRAVVTLRSGASAGAASGVAIRNNDDSMNVTAMAGSAIRGAVLLGGGADALAFDGGRLDPDALLDGGSDPVSAKGPESIDVLRLGGRHRGLIARHLRNWERIVVEAKGLVSFQGRQTLRTGVFHNHGALSMRDGNADDSLTIDGSFAGGGSLVLDVDFALGRADRLTITGNALGAATTVTVSKTGGSDSGADGAIALIDLGGATAADAFALSGGELRSGSRAYRLAYLTDRREFALVPSSAASAAAASGRAQTPAAIPKAATESEAAIGALPSVASAFINPAPLRTNPPVPAAPAPSAGAPARSSPQGGFPTPNVAKAAVAPLSQAGAAPAPAMASAALPVPASRYASARAANPASAPAASAKAPAATQAATTIPVRASGSPAAPRAEESAAASASVQRARPASAAAAETAAPPNTHGAPPAEPTPAPVASAGPSAPASATSAAAPAAAQPAKADPARANGAPAAPRAEESAAAPAAMTEPSTRSASATATETAAPPSTHGAPPAEPAPAPVASAGPSAPAPATSAAAPTAAHSGKTDPARAKESTAASAVAPMRADPAAATATQGTAAQIGASTAPPAAAPEVAANAHNSGSTAAQTVPGIAEAATAAPAARTDDTPASAAAATKQGAGSAPKAEADTSAAAPARDRAESAGNPNGSAASSGGASTVFLRMASIALLEGFARTPTHLQRRWESGNPDSGGIWMLTRDNAGGYADTAAGAVMTTRGGSVQGGTILAKIDGQRGDWIFGAKAQRAHLSAVVHEREGAGMMESRGYGTGATATWLGRSGIYLDLQAQINRILSEFLSFREGPPAPSAKSRIYGTSIEAGAPVPVREGLTALPHAQIGWSRLESAPVENSSAEAASLETGETIFARIGLGLELRTENIDARLTGSLLRDFSDVPGDGAHARASSAARAEFGVGATVSLGGGTVLVKATHRMPLDSDGSGGGSSLSAGMRWSWN